MIRKPREIIIIFLFLSIIVSSECVTTFTNSSTLNTPATQSLALAEVYSAKDWEWLKAIEDQNTLNFISAVLSPVTQEKFQKQPSKTKTLQHLKPEYLFRLYKSGAAHSNSRFPEKMLDITLYKNTNTLRMQLPVSITKSQSLLTDYLTYYYDAPAEVIAYFKSLAPRS
ncbi:hypothetical protein [Clostridium minihomine]|uniref:hypothetical protein n=1 Tax=Clostridium minihomine TaxID=2045012 RepID=UPI000C75D40F|nr:hypothetical protein [Clostridium minihomine]